MELDHVAVPSLNIAASVRWYVETLGAQVLYQDATWAFLQVGQGKVALVTPTQHPPHLAVRVDELTLTEAAREANTPVDREFISATQTATKLN
jgi:catechol 2,3-dioxygenase-like lactoylglutathione lyase family enzyme